MNKLLTKIASLSVGFAMAIGIGVAAGGKAAKRAEAAEHTYTVTFDSAQSVNGTQNIHWKNATVTSGTHDGITWSLAVENDPSFVGSNSYCTIGTSTKPATKISISTTGFATYTIKSASITARCSSNSGPTITIQAGTTKMLNADAVLKQSSFYTHTTNSDPVTLGSTEALLFEFNSSVSAGITFNTITIVYEESGSTTWGVSYFPNVPDGYTYTGSAPTDANEYTSTNNTATVLGSGTLSRGEKYAFLGWNTDKDATTALYEEDDTFTISSNVKLYAIWQQVKFSVTYKSGGGKGSMSDSTLYASGATVTVLECTFTKDWSTFAGWKDQDNNDVSGTFTITKDTTLTATWATAKYEDKDGVFTLNLSTNSFTYSSEEEVDWNYEKVLVYVEKGTSSQAANAYLGGVNASTRFYKNSYLTIAPQSGYAITSIEATATTENYATVLKDSTWTNGTAAVDGTKVTITVTDKNQECYALIGGTSGLEFLAVTYTAGKEHVQYYASDAVLTVGQTVTPYISDQDDNVASGYTLTSGDSTKVSVSGTTITAVAVTSTPITITVSREPTASTVYYSCTFKVTVLSGVYNVTDALAIINAMDSTDPAVDMAVEGIVSTVSDSTTTWSSKKALNYYISVDGTTNNQLYVYKGYYLNGNAFSAATDIKVGDRVVVVGKVKNYNGTTPEFDGGSQIAIQNSMYKFIKEWIDGYMHMGDSDYEGEGSGLCKSEGTYLAAKTALASVESSHTGAISLFRNNDGSQYTEALQRYVNWAKANGDAEPFNGGVSIVSSYRNLANEFGVANSSLIIVLSVISSITIIIAGGYFFIRKKHRD